jgi:hypothetical protein
MFSWLRRRVRVALWVGGGHGELPSPTSNLNPALSHTPTPLPLPLPLPLLRCTQKDEQSYEAELSALDSKIRTTELALSALKVKERKSVYFLVYYSLPLYLTFCTWAIAFRDPGGSSSWLPTWAVCGLPLGGLYALYRGLTTYYGLKRKYEMDRIGKLRTQQKLKVEELKETTKYYAMKGLIERYDIKGGADGEVPPASSSSSPPNTTPNARPLSMSMPSGGRESRESSPSPSVRRATSLNSMHAAFASQGGSEGGWLDVAHLQQQQQQTYPSLAQGALSTDSLGLQAPPTTSTWLDRIMDKVIGAGLDGPTQKWAYICRFCYSHNGLCYEAEWRNPFKCWSCGQLNHHGQEGAEGPERCEPTGPHPDLASTPSSSPLPDPVVEEVEPPHAENALGINE